MTAVGVPVIAETFGDPATYFSVASTESIAVTAMVDRDLAVPLDATGAIEYQTRITIPTSDLNGVVPKRLDTVTIGSEVFVVLARNSNDGYLTQLTVRAGD